MNTELWERQPDESPQAFAAFTLYRDGGYQRSCVKVAQELGKSRTLINRWSSRHGWVSRARAYDQHADREWQLELLQRRREAARRNADLARVAFQRVAKALASLNAGEMDAQAIAQLINSASKLEQLALGGPTATVELTGPGGGPVQTADMTLLTDEERRARLAQLRDELDRRLALSPAPVDEDVLLDNE